MIAIIENKIYNEKSKLETLNKVLNLNSPSNKIANEYINIDNLKEKLNNIIYHKIKSNKEKIFSLNSILQAHNPINILGKGYAIIEGEDNRVLKSKESFKDKEDLLIKMQDGYVKGEFTLLEKGEI